MFLGLVLLLAGGSLLAPLAPAPVAGGRPGWQQVGGAWGSLAADWFWLQGDLAWERRDAGQTRYLISLTLSADPRPAYFWVNSARMLAYDLPAWADEADGNPAPALRANRRKAAARDALRLLQRGLQSGSDPTALQLEMATICLYGLGDQALAAEYFRQAAARPDAPAYAAHIFRRLHKPPG
jgi:hypothetical protein